MPTTSQGQRYSLIFGLKMQLLRYSCEKLS
jgi:hypothetical protein